MKLVAYDPKMLTLPGGPRMVGPQNERTEALGPQDEPLELRYSEDQPRDDHGRFGSTDGEAASGKDKSDYEMLNPHLSDLEAKGMILRNAARDLNFPVDKLEVVSGQGPEFKVGEHAYVEGGHAEIYTTGKVVMYPESIRDESLRGIMAHEVEHIRYQMVLNRYAAERQQMSVWAQSDHEKYDSITTPNGYVDPDKPASSEVPVMAALESFYNKDEDQLVREDGVSNYSKSYWEVYQSTPGLATRERATHETLAEIARMSTKDSPKRDGDKRPSKLWKDFYKSVNKVAANPKNFPVLL